MMQNTLTVKQPGDRYEFCLGKFIETKGRISSTDSVELEEFYYPFITFVFGTGVKK